MKVQILHDAICGGVYIPQGEYMVGLRSDLGMMNLTGAGKEIQIPAKKRRSQAKTRVNSVQFYSDGGKTWCLLFISPKLGEWVCFIEYDELRNEN